MKTLNLSTIRLLLVAIFISLFSYVFASIYFIVTNSDTNQFIPYGQTQLDFENNVFESIGFEVTGNAGWSLNCEEAYTGYCSIKSDSIGNNENSTINISVSLIDGGYLSFFYKVDSEYSTSGNEFYDGLKFYINGTLEEQFQPETDGTSEWNEFTKYLDSGIYDLSWSYIKDNGDGSTSSENDCAWLDDIAIPLAQPFYYDYYNIPPPQNMTSGLFNAFVHPLNSESSRIKAKGGTFADFDLDGDLDLYYGYTTSYYMENQDGRFEDVTSINNINSSGSRGIVVGDVDNNGYPDILKWRYYFDDNFSHFLLMNRGNNIFETTRYLNSSEMIHLHSQGLMDVDLDGDLDLIAIEKENDSQFHVYLNQGLDDDGVVIFENAYNFSRDDDVSSSRTLAIADFDNDGDQDVFVPRKLSKNWLFVNQTLTKDGDEYIYNPNPDQLFIENASEYGIDDFDSANDGSTGYGAAWGDYDNDDDFDLYLTNWGKNRLYENNNNTFTNKAIEYNLESDSLSNGAGWGDFNNDGYIDLWSNNFKREDDLFINPRSTDIDGEWDNSYNPMFLSATQDVVPVDYNNDGQLDMFTPGLLIAHGQEVDAPGYKYTSLLYKNISNDSTNVFNNWINLTLEGSKTDITNDGWSTKSNHSAIGARAIVHTGNLNISREIIAGKGHGSMDPLRLHYGLSNNSIIDGITVKWPSLDTNTNKPKITYFEGPINVNENYRIVEDIGFVGLKGAANNDGYVNISDIVSIVNTILLDQYTTPLYLWSSDFNYSNDLNVIDITILIDFILN